MDTHTYTQDNYSNPCCAHACRGLISFYASVKPIAYIRVWACVPSSNVMRTTRNLGYNYGAPLWTIFGDELSECRCDVSAFDLRRSMCQPSKIDDRCVDLRRSMIDVSNFEDG